MPYNQVTKVVVFDLNETFYLKSSKEEFYKFILKKEPKRIGFIFEMIWFKFQKNLNLMRQTEFKENFFNYLDKLPPDKLNTYAKEFWENEYPQNFNSKITGRLQQAKSRGEELYCASGGLEVYVKPLFDLFEADGFAGTRTMYEGKTYKVIGEACKGDEKVRRVKEHYAQRPFVITECYSDRYEELFELTEKPFLVKDGEILSYKSTLVK